MPGRLELRDEGGRGGQQGLLGEGDGQPGGGPGRTRRGPGRPRRPGPRASTMPGGQAHGDADAAVVQAGDLAAGLVQQPALQGGRRPCRSAAATAPCRGRCRGRRAATPGRRARARSALGVAGRVEPELEHALVDDGGEVGVRDDEVRKTSRCARRTQPLPARFASRAPRRPRGTRTGRRRRRARRRRRWRRRRRPTRWCGAACRARRRRAGRRPRPRRASRSPGRRTRRRPGGRPGRPRGRRCQPAGDLDQQLVAGLVPGDVVDGLEPVEVEHQQAARSTDGAAISWNSVARLGSAVRWSV